MKDVLKLVRKNILELTPYSTARDEYKGDVGVFLDANESPYDNGYNRYPDPAQKALKAKLGKIKHIAPEHIFIGNGSDEAIDLCFRVFCRPGVDNAIAIAPSYGMYKVAAAINDIRMTEVQLGEEYALPCEALLSAADANTKLMFLCSPNNPTGNLFPKEQLLGLVDRFDGMVVVDEAYIDFAGVPSLLTVLSEHNNLIVLQTLSKAWGMAGLRAGLAFGDSKIMDIFAHVKYPYNINVATMQIVDRLLDEGIESRVAQIVSERERVIDELKRCDAVERVFPSKANFVLVRTRGNAKCMYDKLLAGGVIVRDRSKVVLCPDSLRITIGTPEENDSMLQIIKSYRADE